MPRTRHTGTPRIVNAPDLHAHCSFEFVTGTLKRRARILEVGCGEGRLAQLLVEAGYRVTGIDVDEVAIKKARRRRVDARAVGFLDFDDPKPYDAVVFVLSLHHVLPSLSAAVAHAHALLKPGGLLLADEFGRERMNRKTARWFYDMLELLDASGSFSPQARDRHHGRGDPLPEDPLERWRAHHVHDPPLHTARGMRAGIARRFRITSEVRGPHLFRYPCRRLRPGAKGVQVARTVLEQEIRGIAEGALLPAGFQLAARKD